MKRRSSGNKDKEANNSSSGQGSGTKVQQRDMGENEEKQEALYAIRDPRNVHGGARVGTWKDFSDSLANIPE